MNCALLSTRDMHSMAEEKPFHCTRGSVRHEINSSKTQKTTPRSVSKNFLFGYCFSVVLSVVFLILIRNHTDKFYLSTELRTRDSKATEVSKDIPATQPLKLAICIVGQTQRLELPSKAENIVQVNFGDNVETFVFGVLDKGEPHYSNKNSHENKCYKSPNHDANVPKVFKSIFENFGAKHVELLVQEPMIFNISENTMKTVFASYRDEKTRYSRVQNHFRMIMHDKQCAKKILDYERETGSSMDVVFRMRDGALVHSPLRLRGLPNDMFQCMTKKTSQGACVLSKECASHGGYSDKFWVLSRSLLVTTMVKPIEAMLSASHYLQEAKVANSESILKQVWDHNFNGGYRLATIPSVLPVTDSRCKSVGVLPTLEGTTATFESVGNSKDCHPFERSQRRQQARTHLTS